MTSPYSSTATEEVEVSGHIIDSLILPKILDIITAAGGHFEILKFTVGQTRNDPSFALLQVQILAPAPLFGSGLLLRMLTVVVLLGPITTSDGEAFASLTWNVLVGW